MPGTDITDSVDVADQPSSALAGQPADRIRPPLLWHEDCRSVVLESHGVVLWRRIVGELCGVDTGVVERQSEPGVARPRREV